MARILVVDDRPKALEHLAKAAQIPGTEVVKAGTAKEALQRIAEETFDVIVTDVRIETAEAGLDVLRAAKEKDTSTQVIMITAYGTEAVSAESMRLGAFTFLGKNLPGQDIFEVLKRSVTEALEFRNAKLRESGVK